jgi:uncharacterized protein YecE (DUF72 family)
MSSHDVVKIGTCSWKYDSWRGLIYPEKGQINYLQEYSRHYKTVEIDQWFWSLFKGNTAVLPKKEAVREYALSVPDDFTFCIKIPNSLTLTHHYKKNKKVALIPNPHFLSTELMKRFLESIEPLASHLGPLVFQFEYLNKQKMPTITEFFDHLGFFARQLPEDFDYCVETRNPNYLNAKYFDFLTENNLHHVFLQGYYMPSIFDLYEKHKTKLDRLAVIRLHGPDRQGIEKLTGKDWSKIVAPKDHDIDKLTEMISELTSRRIQTYLYVNNHFEGSAPRSISRIEKRLL